METDALARMVGQFENGTLPKVRWTHTAHILMALWYCTQYPLPVAVQKIRKGICDCNVSVGGQNTDASGYHETITLFFTQQIAYFLITSGVTMLTDEVIAEVQRQPFASREFIHAFYSTERLMSREARRQWVGPDRF